MLKVEGHGPAGPSLLEPIELLPVGACPHCEGTGIVEGAHDHITHKKRPTMTVQGPVQCAHCEGSGMGGEALCGALVLVDESGHARPWRPAEGRQEGEAFHRRHRCA